MNASRQILGVLIAVASWVCLPATALANSILDDWGSVKVGFLYFCNTARFFGRGNDLGQPESPDCMARFPFGMPIIFDTIQTIVAIACQWCKRGTMGISSYDADW